MQVIQTLWKNLNSKPADLYGKFYKHFVNPDVMINDETLLRHSPPL